jgi:hypothetical protein
MESLLTVIREALGFLINEKRDPAALIPDSRNFKRNFSTNQGREEEEKKEKFHGLLSPR